MLLLADGLVFSSKTCILISHFLLLPCILPSILIVPYWRGSIQYTYNYQRQNFCFPHLLPGIACAQLSRAVDLSPSQQAAICTNHAAVNLCLLNKFLILCDSFLCCMISHFSSLFLRCHVGFFLFWRGGGDNPFCLQIPYSCLPRSSFLYNFKWPLVSVPLWFLISPQGCSWAVPWSFLLLKWNSFSKTKLKLGPLRPTPMVQNTKAGNCCDSLIPLFLLSRYLLRLFPSFKNIPALSEGFNCKYFLKVLCGRTLVPSHCLSDSRFSFRYTKRILFLAAAVNGTGIHE